MTLRTRFVAMAVALLIPLSAAAADTDKPIDAATRKAVVERLAEQLKTHYVFPDVATQTGAALKGKLAAGAYDHDVTTDTFARHLSTDLRASAKDLHLNVQYQPGMELPPETGDAPKPSRKDLDGERDWVDSIAGGIASVRRLRGNVAYIDLWGFVPADFAADRFAAMMVNVSGADSLILDLRQNTGGDPHAIALLISYFVDENDSKQLTSLHWRKGNETVVFNTFPVSGPRFHGPIRVLISPRTISAGEACAYDLQVLKRATLVGTTTAGGANPAATLSLGNGFTAEVAEGQAVNPITKTNWEHVGVKPDIPTTPEKAMDVAYGELLEWGLKNARDDDAKARIQAALVRFRNGNWDKPDFSPIYAD
jgi:hypothetical protein